MPVCVGAVRAVDGLGSSVAQIAPADVPARLVGNRTSVAADRLMMVAVP
jgi:hypothetical protein